MTPTFAAALAGVVRGTRVAGWTIGRAAQVAGAVAARAPADGSARAWLASRPVDREAAWPLPPALARRLAVAAPWVGETRRGAERHAYVGFSDVVVRIGNDDGRFDLDGVCLAGPGKGDMAALATLAGGTWIGADAADERFRGGLGGRPTRIAGLDATLADLMGAVPDAGIAWLLGPLSRSAAAADVEATDHEGRVADGTTTAVVRELAAHAFRCAEPEMVWEEGDEGGPREFDSNWTLVGRPYLVHADEGAGSGALDAASRRGAARRTLAWLATSGAGPGLVAAAGRAMGTGDLRAEA